VEAKELLSYKNWVVVGDVLNSNKYAFRILNSLKGAGFNVVGVNPKDNTGEAYKSIKEVPFNIEVVDLCINPVKGLEIVQEVKSMNLDKILIQPGAESEDILKYCKENNMVAIEGCALVELSHYKKKL
jgi:predicted CoA-binding protein